MREAENREIAKDYGMRILYFILFLLAGFAWFFLAIASPNKTNSSERHIDF